MTSGPRLVTSVSNDRVKSIRALEMRKERKATGLFVAEGASILVSAREAGFEPVALVYGQGSVTGDIQKGLVDWALDAGAEVLEVSEAVLQKLAAKDNPQSMLAVFKQRHADLPAPSAIHAEDLWLALEEPRDPGNLGTIIRTVDAVGAKGVILIGQTTDPWSHECVRATMGSIFAVPLVRTTREAFLAWRAGWKGDVAGLHLSGREDFRAAQLKGPALVVMGSEGPGLTDSLTRSCTRLLRIPMAGKLDSLNLAVATALTLYQLRGPHLKL